MGIEGKPHHSEVGPADRVVLEIEKQLEELEETYQLLVEKAEAGESVCFSEYGRTIDYDVKEDVLFCYGKGGAKLPLSWGDIRSAMMFGVEYQFGDKSISQEKQLESEYVKCKLAFVTVVYQHRKQHLQNLKIAYEESINPLNRNHSDEAYEGTYESMKLGDVALSRGRLAEKMLHAFLTKYFSDNPGEGFPIDPGPVMDVEYKIDLLIQVPTLDQSLAEVAVQFSIDDSDASFEKKQAQAQRGLFRLQHEYGGLYPIISYHIITSSDAGGVLCDAYKRWRGYDAVSNPKPIRKCDPRGPIASLTEGEYEKINPALQTLFDDLHNVRTMTPKENTAPTNTPE